MDNTEGFHSITFARPHVCYTHFIWAFTGTLPITHTTVACILGHDLLAILFSSETTAERDPLIRYFYLPQLIAISPEQLNDSLL